MYNFKSVRQIGALALLVGAMLPAAAHAGTANATVAVTAAVTASCNITGGTLAFGNYSPLANTNTDATTNIAVACTKTTPYSITLSKGVAFGATFAVRSMASVAAPTNLLNYSLYTDSAYTKIWGDGTAATFVATGAGTGTTQNITIYGRIPSGQTTAIPAADYSDTVTATINY